MAAVILLFILILCVACAKRKKAQVSPEQDQNAQNLNQQNDGDEYENDFEEEEVEKVIPLGPEDYELYFSVLKEATLQKKKDKIKDEVCSICIDKLMNGEPIRKVKFCPHYFHAGCLIDWVKVNETCPNCKLDLCKKSMEKMQQELEERRKNRGGNLSLIDPDKKPLMEMGDRKRNPISFNPVPTFDVNRPQSGVQQNARDVRVTRQNAGDIIQQIEDSQADAVNRSRRNDAEFVENQDVVFDFNPQRPQGRSRRNEAQVPQISSTSRPLSRQQIQSPAMIPMVIANRRPTQNLRDSQQSNGTALTRSNLNQ